MTSAMMVAPEDTDSPIPAPEVCLAQLGNAVALVSKQDQIVWAIFGAFWAANAVLLVALFTTGDFPSARVGLIVSASGLVWSIIWWRIESRAIAWLIYYEGILREIEQVHLRIPSRIAFTGSPERVQGRGVRPLILACSALSAALWGWATVRFAFVEAVRPTVLCFQ